MASDSSVNDFFKDFVLKRDKIENEENKKDRTKRIAPFAIKEFSTFRVLDYYEESKSNFINGCFRSCIISSAIAVDQTLKFFLISISEDWEETYWEIEMKKLNFCDLIEKIKKTKKVSNQVLADVDWLRHVRNEIAVHPIFIGQGFELKEPPYIMAMPPDFIIWSNKIMLRDIRKLLRFVEPEPRKKIEGEKISSRNSNGEIIEEFSINDYFKSEQLNFSKFLIWGALQETILEELAYEAYTKSVKIINTVLLVLESKPSNTEIKKEKEKMRLE